MSQREARWNLNDPLPAEGTGNVLEAAGLVAATVGELAQIARRHHLETLGFLLDMALLEAEDVIRSKQMQTKI